MEIQIHPVKKEELNSYHQMQERYLNKEKFSEFCKNVKKYKGLYLCAVSKEKIFGIVYPGTHEGELYLKGICVDLSKKLNGKGIGSKLIKAFEKAIKIKGIDSITVGAAEDPKVEHFYLKNGWHPIQLIFHKIKKLPSNYKGIINKEGLSEEREDDGTKRFRMPMQDYEEGKIIRKRLEHELNAEEGCFIFEKELI